MLSSHGRGIRPLDALKKDSQDLSRVLARIPEFPRLVPVTSGRFSGCLCPAPRLRGHGRLWGCSSRPGEASQPCAESRPILLSACLPAQPSAGPSTKALPDVRSPLLGSSCPFVGLTRQAGTRLPADDGLTCPPPGPLRTRCHWEACGTWPRSCRPSTLEGFPRPPHRPQAMPTWHVCPPLALTLCSLRLRPDPCLNRSSPDPCHGVTPGHLGPRSYQPRLEPGTQVSEDNRRGSQLRSRGRSS